MALLRFLRDEHKRHQERLDAPHPRLLSPQEWTPKAAALGAPFSQGVLHQAGPGVRGCVRIQRYHRG